jgi:hypothetical protein
VRERGRAVRRESRGHSRGERSALKSSLLQRRERGRQEDLVFLRDEPVATTGRRPHALLPGLVEYAQICTNPFARPNSTPPANTIGESFERSPIFDSQPFAVSGSVPGFRV